SIHDVKAIRTSGDDFRFKAEIDFDGEQLVYDYLKTENAKQLIKNLDGMKDNQNIEKFLVQYGDQIIDFLGAEIDRIEKFICRRYPNLKHMDLE
ncbi:MAG: hypothetical protein MHPSP_004719, partial [Paramarteilia canceri]